ncbi:MAG: cation diffusion facilitator family transporter [Clostridium sp.]|jgi:cation diffusion facilitator family transporter|nr:cation diffusion facilitator family transporter [Clostridium sp.]
MDRFKSTKIASMLGIIGNLFLLIIKGIVASLSGSQAMVADAFNSAGDIFSSLMTYVGNRISCKKADDDHNLGHGKAEYIYSMLISISMLLMATFVLKDSIKSLFYGSKYTFSIWLIVVCIVTIIVKFSLFLYTNTLYKKHNNLLILANSKDHLNDTIITSLNLISCVLSSYNIFFLDGIVGSIISIWIMYTAIKLFIESYNVLMDKSISIETKNKVLDIIKEEKQVKKVIHFNSTPVGYKYQISFTIYVDGNMSTFDSHEIANNLEEKIVDKVEEIYLVVIHVNPM